MSAPANRAKSLDLRPMSKNGMSSSMSSSSTPSVSASAPRMRSCSSVGPSDSATRSSSSSIEISAGDKEWPSSPERGLLMYAARAGKRVALASGKGAPGPNSTMCECLPTMAIVAGQLISSEHTSSTRRWIVGLPSRRNPLPVKTGMDSDGNARLSRAASRTMPSTAGRISGQWKGEEMRRGLNAVSCRPCSSLAPCRSRKASRAAAVPERTKVFFMLRPAMNKPGTLPTAKSNKERTSHVPSTSIMLPSISSTCVPRSQSSSTAVEMADDSSARLRADARATAETTPCEWPTKPLVREPRTCHNPPRPPSSTACHTVAN
mmetsp:Transcript_47437/g.144368  ORF Transcript_47437/g.144368 Transcript_47437/m.144368 type:complete len:320 (-) Transcript_47437:133-1092(-)